MKIKYLSGPKAGQIEHVQNQVGGVVVGAGLAEEIAEPSAPQSGFDHQGKWTKNDVFAVLEPHAPLPRAGQAVAIPTPAFAVVLIGEEPKKLLAIEMKAGPTIVRFHGDPRAVNACQTWPGGKRWLSGFGREVPDEVVKEYARRCKEYPAMRGYDDKPQGPYPDYKDQCNLAARIARGEKCWG